MGAWVTRLERLKGAKDEVDLVETYAVLLQNCKSIWLQLQKTTRETDMCKRSIQRQRPFNLPAKTPLTTRKSCNYLRFLKRQIFTEKIPTVTMT